MRDDADRVVAIMMKAPRAGRVKTRLTAAYPIDVVLALYRALVEDTLDVVRRSRAAVAAVCPLEDAPELARWLPTDVTVVPQRGGGLAAGLVSAFEQLCTTAGRPVVAFNADSPHLPPTVLEAAFAALTHADLVVGPCDDGGYYLVGATRPHEGLFDAAAMGKESACRALLAEAERLGLRVFVATEHYDVDVPGDLLRLAADLREDPSRAPRTAALLSEWSLGPSLE